MKLVFTFFCSLLSVLIHAQSSTTQVMTLGTFHFNFPNLDVIQTGASDKIDVLEPRFQKEIEAIVGKIARFKPTIIVIERQPSRQRKTDSLLASYCQGTYLLKRSEEEQIGFRLAKRLGIKTLYCVDEWGNFNEEIGAIVYGKDSVEAAKFEAFFENNPDSAKSFNLPPIFKTKGIAAALREYNNELNVRKSLGNYLTGLIKYESTEHDFKGVDFETGRWFSRNLKIFRNIQRIGAGPSDRVLVIYGAGHLNLLNYFFDCSPEFNRVATNAYLK